MTIQYLNSHSVAPDLANYISVGGPVAKAGAKEFTERGSMHAPHMISLLCTHTNIYFEVYIIQQYA